MRPSEDSGRNMPGAREKCDLSLAGSGSFNVERNLLNAAQIGRSVTGVKEYPGHCGNYISMRIQENRVEWDEERAKALPHQVVRTTHRLVDTELFTDESLIRIFETHDPDYLLVYRMGSDHTKLDDFELGKRGNLSSTELLEAVKQGKYWLNILRMQDCHAEFAELINGVYDELEAKMPGFRAYFRSANLLVSSPSAQVYFHADAPLNMLWHMRGQKKVYVYPPNDERFAPAEHVEMIFTRESDDDLPYDPSFDEFATAYELDPGQMITWPQNTPHRVENVSGLNVSLTTEHFTPEGIRKRNTYLANHYLRRWLRLPMRSTRTDGFLPALKRAAYYACKRLPLAKAEAFEDSADFSLQDQVKE